MQTESTPQGNVTEILKPFLETMLERDALDREFRKEQQVEANKKFDKLSDTVANMNDKMGELITVVQIQEQKHIESEQKETRTNETLQDHGSRIYTAEKEIIGMKKDIESNTKPWIKFNNITTIIIAGVVVAGLVFFLGFK